MLDTLIQASRNPIVMLLLLLAVASFGVAVYLAIVLLQREKKADNRLKQARADITDMTILFQTMRDIIGQQKKLAKEFNEELEHKMGQVKHILNQGMEKNKQLYEKQQRIAADLHEAQAQIDGIYRQIGHTRDGAPLPSRRPTQEPPAEPTRVESVIPDKLPPRAEPRRSVSPPAQTGNGIPGPDGRDMLRKAKPPPAKRPEPPAPSVDPEKLSQTGVTKASFTSWVAEDLAVTPPKDPRKTPPPTAKPTAATEAAPSNGDAAREAFRALLNMPPEEKVNHTPLDLPSQISAMTDAPSPTSAPEPSVDSATAMQQRVLEYSDAGMTVADISRELGIGKGEVRLMLSLARQSTTPNS